MREALKEAKQARLKDEVPIGAVVVKDGEIIARAQLERDDAAADGTRGTLSN